MLLKNENCLRLIDTIKENNPLWIKYNYCVRLSDEEYGNDRTWLDGTPGRVRLSAVSTNQKIASGLFMAPSSIEEFESKRSFGNLIIRIRSVIFLESCISTITPPIIKTSQGGHFLYLKVTDKVFRSICKQIK
jgi:hypothetical protein